MSRNRLLFTLVFFGLVIGAAVAIRFLPKHYAVGETMFRPTIFWNNHEAFIFLDTNRAGKATNVVQDEVATKGYGYFALLFGMGDRFSNYQMKAYWLLPSGKLIETPLPPDAAPFGKWSLRDGDLQLAPPPNRELYARTYTGFWWDGAKFVTVLPENGLRNVSAGAETVQPDDTADDDADSAFVTASARSEFKAAGWHWKQLTAFEPNAVKLILPIQLGSSVFSLTLNEFPARPNGAHFDPLAYGAKSLEVSRTEGAPQTQVIWSQKGWQSISKAEFDQEAWKSGRLTTMTFGTWILWFAVFLFLILWRFGSWAHLFFSLFTMKGRVLKNMGTSYSFPPAVPGQFPKLDTEKLNYYTQEFEGMGFTRLGDFSLVSDAAKSIPSFCRLFVNSKQHCFGTAFQFFPMGKSPRPLKCTITSSLENGWDLNFGDRKPVAASSLVRRPRGIGVSMPEARPYELLNAFLQMRTQVCEDLGVSPLKNDTLEAYVAKLQASHKDIRDSVKRRSFARGISQVYWRKFSLLKTKQEYVWLGDYPKEAERHRQGSVIRAPAL
ncbi:MAG TPA: hypothetical protein VGR81_05300 [Candidatus Acidoferrales bacterium]|nr:hypothetical protein [Candidatus Acidoferrales bacterium]